MSYRTVARIGVAGKFRGLLTVHIRADVSKRTLTPPPDFGRMSMSYRREHA